MRQIDDNASENAVSMLVAKKVFYKFRLIFKRIQQTRMLFLEEYPSEMGIKKVSAERE